MASMMFIALSALTLLASSAAYSELSANAVLAAATAADSSGSSSHIDAAHCFDMAATLPEAVSSPEPLTSTISGKSLKHSRAGWQSASAYATVATESRCPQPCSITVPSITNFFKRQKGYYVYCICRLII
ncbi:MAG: hypothetical protein ACI4A8_07825 [Muribaculaceae bacterium]